jgi:uncharacterized protein (TIGR00369 family)
LEERAVRRVPALSFFQITPTIGNRFDMKTWDASPFLTFMGLTVTKRSPERSEAELVNREDLCNRRDVMHGGAIMALADIMGGMTASASLSPDQATATIESKTNFLAPIPKGDKVHAVCTPLHSGRTTIVLQTNITRGDGRLAAMVTQTQIVLPKSA